jgi:hypothetical protein
MGLLRVSDQFIVDLKSFAGRRLEVTRQAASNSRFFGGEKVPGTGSNYWPC